MFAKYINKGWEFWIQKFAIVSGKIYGKPIEWDRRGQILKLKRPAIIWRIGVLLLTFDNFYQFHILLTLDYAIISLQDIMKFLLHSTSRLMCLIVELDHISSQMALTHFNEVLIVHRKFESKSYFKIENK